MKFSVFTRLIMFKYKIKVQLLFFILIFILGVWNFINNELSLDYIVASIIGFWGIFLAIGNSAFWMFDSLNSESSDIDYVYRGVFNIIMVLAVFCILLF